MIFYHPSRVTWIIFGEHSCSKPKWEPPFYGKKLAEQLLSSPNQRSIENQMTVQELSGKLVSAKFLG
jgi:hypothetical protein